MSDVQTQIESGRPQTVAPLLPLALLESVRAHDRPREVLEDENLSASLPRRLGLTGVVESQIQRYEQAAKRGRHVPVDEVLDLLRLVLRRPDAEPILREAGFQIARRHFRRLPAPAVSALAILPRAAANAALRRSARTMFRKMSGPGRTELGGWPLEARIIGAITAQAAEGDGACVLYGAALEELVFLYTRRRPQVVHSRCGARGEECCEWKVMA